MAVRIALQCSEADAHLILSEDNSAARLLTRPGEAIYNDANGMVEGNNFFQVVWLSDERREDYLEQIRDLARERKPGLARTPIVFEGNAPADLEPEPAARAACSTPRTGPTPPRSTQAWLGDADRDQGPDRGRLPPPERQQPADRRPEGGDRARPDVAAAVSLAAQAERGQPVQLLVASSPGRGGRDAAAACWPRRCPGGRCCRQRGAARACWPSWPRS